jgi:hypothetical protein
MAGRADTPTIYASWPTLSSLTTVRAGECGMFGPIRTP